MVLRIIREDFFTPAPPEVRQLIIDALDLQVFTEAFPTATSSNINFVVDLGCGDNLTFGIPISSEP